jgi:hypothetical protein
MARKTGDTQESAEDRYSRELMEVDVSDIPDDRPESVELANCIDNANHALEEKAEVLSRIQSARMLSTLLIQNNSGSQEQVRWVRFHLPRKTRKTNGVDEDE